jgi:hypothetical protein
VIPCPHLEATVQIKTVSVTYERKQNLGDYSSATAACSLWADVDEDEDLDAIMHALWEMAKANVKAQITAAVGKSIDFSTTFMGLPLEPEEVDECPQ